MEALPRNKPLPGWLLNLALLGVIAALLPINSLVNDNLTAYAVDVLIRIGLAIILAVSLNLINGITGQFSLGHAAFMGIGAYTGGVLMHHYDPPGWWGTAAFFGVTILGGLVAALAGLLVGIPALRLRGDYLAIATLGFNQIVITVLQQIDSIGSFETGGAIGLHGIPHHTNLFWVYTWVLICTVSIWRLVRSGKGKPFLSIREDEIAAGAMGVNTTFYKVAAFVVGAFFAGAAGSLSAMFELSINPTSYNFMRSVEIVVMVVLGGSGSITGAMLAAAVLTYMPEQLRFMSEGRWVIYALLLIVMMLLRPAGLLGKREIWWTRKRSPAPQERPT